MPRPWRWSPTLAKLAGRHREVGCSRANTGLQAALSRSGTCVAVSCGHNHYNDYVSYLGGLYLCFGRISGLSPPTTWESDGGPLPFTPGGRVMAVDTKTGGVTTWVQAVDGAEEDRICLIGSRGQAATAARSLLHGITGEQGGRSMMTRSLWLPVSSLLVVAAVALRAILSKGGSPSSYSRIDVLGSMASSLKS